MEDGSVIAVPLPGHSIGHTGYIIKSKDRRYIFSGDATFNDITLKAGIPFVILNDAESEHSVRTLWKFAQSSDVVVLCSHDPQVANKLESISS